MAFAYLGTLFSETRIRTNNYILLQFPKEITSNTFYSFSHKFTEFWLIRVILAQLLEEYHVTTSKQYKKLEDLKTDAFER